jgi:hypothetical protein
VNPFFEGVFNGACEKTQVIVASSNATPADSAI